MAGAQRSLFGREPDIAFDAAFATLERRQLDDEAWLDYAPGWLTGHESLFEHLAAATRWQEHQREMYDRIVDVPRLVASVPEHSARHPILQEVGVSLERRYGCAFPYVTLAYYRSGKDSVAFHGDYIAREMPDAVVATVSVGAPRRFLLRPKAGGSSISLMLGWGDLLVMGGACQRTWDHAIPKASQAGPRIAIMFRPDWYARAPSWRARSDP